MKAKKKQRVGRPKEGRVKLTCYVLPLTKERIERNVRGFGTQGKVVDFAIDKAI